MYVSISRMQSNFVTEDINTGNSFYFCHFVTSRLVKSHIVNSHFVNIDQVGS